MGLRLIVLMILLMSAALTGGCAASYNASDTAQNARLDSLPEKFDHAARKPAQYPDRWWEKLESSELNSLIDKMFSDNLQIAAAYEGLKALAASYRITRGDSGFGLNAKIQTGGNYTEKNDLTDSYGLLLNASYEADLWNRLKSRQRADVYALLAEKYDTETLYMTLAAEMAQQYINYVTYSKQLDVRRESEKLYSGRLEARERLYRSGIGRMSDVLEAKKSLESVQGEILTVSKSRDDAKSAIALLLGRADTDFSVTVQNIKIAPMPEAVPARVAVQRPDIRSALAEISKTDNTLAAAAAAKYPTLNFTASTGYSAGDFTNLLSPENFAAQILGSLIMPVFNGGAINAEIERQRANLQKSVYSYQQTVIAALNETRKALAANYYAERTLENQIGRHESDVRLFEIAKMRYEKGIDDYEAVLNTRITLAERAFLVQSALGQTAAARVELIRSIGGSWAGEISDKRMSDDIVRLFSEVKK